MKSWTRMQKAAAAGALVAAGFGGGAAVMVAGPVAADGDRPSSEHRDEELLTGDALEQVTSAVEEAYPGASVERAETDADGVYEAHITTVDGEDLTVELDESYAVTGTEAHRGRGPSAGIDARRGVDAAAVTTEDQLVTLVREAYGDPRLGLHRGHLPVEDVLVEVLATGHDELHERMRGGQNLAAVAEDVGVDPQTLVAALVESLEPAVDTLVEDGTITEAEGRTYRRALTEAFDFRVTWDGEAETPVFTGV